MSLKENTDYEPKQSLHRLKRKIEMDIPDYSFQGWKDSKDLQRALRLR